MGQKYKPANPAVVGVVDSPAARRLALRLQAGALDVLEWRADCLPGARKLPDSIFPWILTVRHPREGGMGNLADPERERLFLRLLPGAAFVDLELRSFRAMRRVLEVAKGVRIIASFHDFQRTPGAAALRDLAGRAEDSGADILKIATRATEPEDIVRLLELFSLSSLPVAVMGMGPLGFSSRLLFAASGSVLNYGWLHRPNVPGQWPALELKSILARR